MASIAAEQTILPQLRQELQIRPGRPQLNGAPTWTLFDPIRHMFFQIGKVEFRIFSLWSGGQLSKIQEHLTGEGMSEEDAELALRKVLEFSLANSLTIVPAQPAVESFTAQFTATRKAWWRWMVDHYLFIRIPLVRPAEFLQRSLPYAQIIWSPFVLILFALMGITGLLLVSRQWDAFMVPLSYLFSIDGIIAYGLALGLVKIAHEFGHAYMATRFGCRVPTMGVSFLVMMPVLYTDTTAAWQLRSRKQRLMIDCAGVSVELMIASAATLLWALLPDGPVRSGLHVIATTSWVTSLFINLSPFMRFDGYYLLSDAIDMPNLQPRAFALGRWQLREWLFKLGDAPPERLSERRRILVILYAYATWVYRFFLFLGIAFLVYHFFFKALGILLFAVEMVVFIGRPVYREVATWYQMRDRIFATKRGRIWPWAFGGLALLFVLPLDRHVSAPAILSPIGDSPIVAGTPAQVQQVVVRSGQQVKAGDTLFILSDPAIERDVAASKVRIARLETQQARAGADARELSNLTVLERELATERNYLSGLEQRSGKLTLRAPADGMVVDVPTDLHPGRWLAAETVIGRIITPGRYDVQAYLSEDAIWRVGPDANARFIPDDAAQMSRRARLTEAAKGASEYLDSPILATTNGGSIPVSKDDRGKLKPQKAIYRVKLIAERDDASDNPGLVQPVPGRVSIDAKGESMLARTVRGFGRIFARERGVTG